MVLPSQITASTNDIGIISDILEDTTDTYFVNSNNDKIRCPPGYVFEGSHSLFDGKDKSIIEYNIDTDKWIVNGDEVDWPVDTITCKRKYCEPLGIVNSDKEYDVVVDDIYDSSKLVTCNGGYVFDTTDTRLGKVRCGVIPIMTNNELDDENNVTWLADTRHLELHCESRVNETECNTIPIPIKITNDTSKIYDENGKKFNCTWVPPINDNDSGFIRTEGQCKFIHRADLNENEPICRAMYCNSKEIPNSNRTNTESGPLPGPEIGSIHGDCVNFDGQIINNITNSSDCACFQHKSCDMCTSNENCQWCGSDDNGEGGFCYSTKTHLSICDNSIRHNRGGTCLHSKTGRAKIGEPDGGWTEDSCENDILSLIHI